MTFARKRGHGCLFDCIAVLRGLPIVMPPMKVVFCFIGVNNLFENFIISYTTPNVGMIKPLKLEYRKIQKELDCLLRDIEFS